MSAEVGLAEVIVGHQRIPTFQGPGRQRCSGCDSLRNETDGPNSPRHAAHVAQVILTSDWLAERDARIKAEERAAWLAKIEALVDEWGWMTDESQTPTRRDMYLALRALLPSDATAACACVCHSGGVGTGCRQSRCEVCPPATAALNTVREQAKAEERVHDHPPYRPACNERLVEGQLRGACLNDDGSEAGR